MYKRKRTDTVERAMHIVSIGMMVASRFDGFSTLGSTPYGGLPAGPSNNACISRSEDGGGGEAPIMVTDRTILGLITSRCSNGDDLNRLAVGDRHRSQNNCEILCHRFYAESWRDSFRRCKLWYANEDGGIEMRAA